jgi:hypothetical protein
MCDCTTVWTNVFTIVSYPCRSWRLTSHRSSQARYHPVHEGGAPVAAPVPERLSSSLVPLSTYNVKNEYSRASMPKTRAPCYSTFMYVSSVL